MLRLGQIYEEGKPGVPRDPALALRWYRRAQELHNRDAPAAIARLTNNGSGSSRPASASATPAATTPRTEQNAAGGAGTLQANDLYRASKSDPAGTNARYNGKLLTITGTVWHAGTSPFATFALLGPSDDFYITCNFPPAAKATVESLRKGQTVTLRGTYMIVGTSLFLIKDCELVR